jgi:hypothetical protein
VQGQSFSACDSILSGLIALALAMRDGGSVAELRIEIAHVLERSLTLREGFPPNNEDPRCRHRDALLKATLPNTMIGLRRRNILQKNFHGDITSDEVVLYVAEAAKFNKKRWSEESATWM